MSNVTHRPRPNRSDRGSTLILVLVLVVIVGLVTVPLMTYAISINRASAAEGEKARDVEAAKGGVQTAIADRGKLYNYCGGPNADVSMGAQAVGSPNLSEGVSTTCDLVSTVNLKPSSEVPFAVATVQVDSPTPSTYTGIGSVYTNPNTQSATDYDLWLDADFSRVSLANRVWVPDLPVRATTVRDGMKFYLDSEPMPPSPAACQIYHPGTYLQPLTVSRNAFFVSGVYYFEDIVTFEADPTYGVNAVIGDGSTIGCSDDVDGINYIQQWPAPGPGDPVPPVNISGQGATFILGENARIVVENTAAGAGPLDITFNRRYVDPLEEAALPTAGVSIMSVNGDDETDDGPGGVSTDLAVPNVIGVPFSKVTGVTPAETAHDGGYKASVHNAKPELPDPPVNVSGVAHDGAVVITWEAPPINTWGGLPIDTYLVEANNGALCDPEPTDPGRTFRSCAIDGLTNATPYTFTVITTTAAGDSVPSAPITVTPNVATPSAFPDPPVATAPDPLDGAIRARGVASAFDGGSPILGYRADAHDGLGVVQGTCWIDVVTNPLADSCIVYGLNNNEPYTVVGYAFNAFGTSLESADSPPATPTTASGPTPPPTPNPLPDPVVPDPIIEFDLTGGLAANVEFFSYVSVPQGQIEIRTNAGDPSGSDVRFRGGVVTGRFVPFGPPSTFKLDIENPVAQRTIRVTSTAGSAASTAVLQVNATGASAVSAWVTQ